MLLHTTKAQSQSFCRRLFCPAPPDPCPKTEERQILCYAAAQMRFNMSELAQSGAAKERTNERKKAHFRIKHRIHCLHARSLLGSKAEEKESLLLLAASKQEQGQSVVAPTLPEKYTIMVFFSRCLRLRRLLGISSSASSDRKREK